MSKRLTVPKTYKLYIGGKFPRSESGRTYEVISSKGDFLANAALASRKDARDAVTAARGAVKGWAGATAYNRGQVLYRVAEILEGRKAQFVDEIVQQTGISSSAAAAEVDEAIDRWVWYAGWCDKFGQVAGNGNPVAGPYFNISVPEPTGVVAVVAPQDTALVGLVSAIAPALVSGNSVVVIASQRFPLSAISLAEVLATSDVPGESSTCSPARRPRSPRGSRRTPTCTASTWSAPAISTGSTCRSRPPRRSRACCLPSRGRMPRPRASSGSPRSPRRRRSGTPRA
nr:hypothetical protein GCM10025699_21940 [Microbacterium flavescens]